MVLFLAFIFHYSHAVWGFAHTGRSRGKVFMIWFYCEGRGGEEEKDKIHGISAVDNEGLESYKILSLS